ncbi:transglycosylase [Humibacillus sp. DSM 29435]|uniref:resuscitation-promoting factor n=1 Tax=Humibacillus sp. DSM 29435 TaxID=1869167 RepID=UPI0008728AA6|nr:resuscitation-promoting factor [Humibacillus sp. DSM 29435]OFE15081.1 transglycosylase [Humibacillus sp. DSM 29435]
MFSRNTKVLSFAGAGAALLLTAAGVGAAQIDKAVTLSVDGQARAAHVFGSTVGDLLENQGITIGADDRVVPAVGAALHDGDTVNVAYARPLTVTVDGKTRTVNTTERTVEGALAALGLREEGGRLSVSRSQTIGRSGLAMSLVTPKQVSIVADGKTTKKTITAGTVGEALVQLRIAVGGADQVTPAVSAPLTDAMTVTVKRVTTRSTSRTESIPFATVRTSSSQLYTGDTKVDVRGVNGARTVTTRQTLVDGAAYGAAKSDAKVTKAPTKQVLLVGTKTRPAPAPRPSTPSASKPPSGGSGGAINLARAGMWDGIAACESGNNWSINTGNGYYGGLQFASSTWLGAGGGDFAPRADLASRAEQITVANRLYATSGTSQWGCG